MSLADRLLKGISGGFVSSDIGHLLFPFRPSTHVLSRRAVQQYYNHKKKRAERNTVFG